MQLIILSAAVLLLLLLIARCKLNAFLALLVASFFVAFANGLSLNAAVKSVTKGIGDTMGSLALILVFGAMLGKSIEESGAAHTISQALTRLFGRRRLQWSVVVTGLLVGLPMVYNASFLVLIPLVYTLSVTSGVPLMALGIPLSSALSVTHGYLPPHPAPASIAVLYGADVNRTLLYGLVLTPIATVLAGPVLAHFFRHLKNTPPPELYTPRAFQSAELPPLSLSLLATLAPVLLMLAGADPSVALGVAALFALWSLGLRRGRGMDSLMKSVAAAIASVSMVMLIIAGGGAFKQVLLDGGTGRAIEQWAKSAHLHPILLAWLAAALLRLALGSATVAAITAAGLVLPVVPGAGVAPELLVLATTAGSLMFSHFNDIGFWMFKQYYNVSIRQTFQIWTVMESIVAVVGLLGAFALSAVVAKPAGPKIVLHINSYHAGYSTSDQAGEALKKGLESNGLRYEVFYLDAKRQQRPDALVPKALAKIKELNPALIVAGDDDAVKFVIKPHLAEIAVPVVFCGVNWSADEYTLPSDRVTGILEVLPIEETLNAVRRQFQGARKLITLSEDSTSERNNKALMSPIFRGLGFEPTTVMVKTFDDWKREFIRAQTEADILYLPTNGAIQGWDAAEAKAFVLAQTRKPSVTCDGFMTPYAAFGLTKEAAEQGEWAAASAVAILQGRASPASIAVARNSRFRCYFNPAVAARAGLRLLLPEGESCQKVE
ncbi:MAG: hypothetical protein HXY18_16310 [Bryobacteraceae bacterium]|nr:hypothetical protein [Bryobacteraceae bacterium]